MKNFFLLCLSVALMAGCTKNDDLQLPEATHHGANTFGCKINGEIFSISGKAYLGHHDGVTIHPSLSSYWYVDGAVGKKSVTLMFDFKSNPALPGTFELGRNEPYRGHYFYCPDGTVPTGSTEWITDEVNKGTVTVTHYTTSFASGTFAFDAKNGDGNIVHITDGRFDISFD
jgi:hypothetical protein